MQTRQRLNGRVQLSQMTPMEFDIPPVSTDATTENAVPRNKVIQYPVLGHSYSGPLTFTVRALLQVHI